MFLALPAGLFGFLVEARTRPPRGYFPVDPAAQHPDDHLHAFRWSLATSLGTAPSAPDDECLLASRS